MAEVKHLVGKVVGPGDVICNVPSSGVLRLGPGLVTRHGRDGQPGGDADVAAGDAHADGDGTAVRAIKSGVLRQQARSGQLWLESRTRRYIPAEGELVVGYILDRHAENFLVDIGGPFNALLPTLAFEGATKRNRPNLRPGDVVYARVAAASRDMEPSVTCVDASGRASGMGHLKEGTVVQVSTSGARRMLQSPPPPHLAELGRLVAFEMAPGANGRVWVSAADIAKVVLLAQVLQKADTLSDAQAAALVRRMCAAA